MSLHCLKNTDVESVARLVALVSPGDAILLIGTAVTGARSGHGLLAQLTASNATLYALEEDLALYGVQRVDERVSIADYAGWVDLATRHDRQLLWR